MKKVMTVLGTRPEIIKMSALIKKLDVYFEHTLVHTGQNYDYELNEIFFTELGVRKPDFFLNVATDSLMSTVGGILKNVDEVIEKVKPDAFLIYGDTNSCLSSFAAKRRKVPIFHFEAGNRCFDQRVPEEINRKIVDHISDINFVLSDQAKRYLESEGLKAERIFTTGSHMFEVLNEHKAKISGSDILSQLGFEEKSYFLVSLHREENVDDQSKLASAVAALECVSKEFGVPVVVSTHPRTKSRIDNSGISTSRNIQFLKPFGFFDYCNLQQNSMAVISDSGTITEEASMLGFKAVMLREMHERPEGVDVGAVPMAGLSPESLADAVRICMHTEPMKGVQHYDNYVSDTIVRIIVSYIDYVNREVWKK